MRQINVLDAPSTGYVQQKDYKFCPPTSTEDDADWGNAITINALPLNAAICKPEPHARLSVRPCTVRGFAIATSGFHDRTRGRIARRPSHMESGDVEPHAASPWSCTPWQIVFDLWWANTKLQFVWDAFGQTQHPLPDDTWYFKGYLSASWHRVSVIVFA